MEDARQMIAAAAAAAAVAVFRVILARLHPRMSKHPQVEKKKKMLTGCVQLPKACSVWRTLPSHFEGPYMLQKEKKKNEQRDDRGGVMVCDKSVLESIRLELVVRPR